ncbi:MAG: hypothetical protein C4560_00720 [Nitrospiraceae bacterium]|nr:MAG: hypothetical protein C4560_00720 [Nitrospiraceae bacterium]
MKKRFFIVSMVIMAAVFAVTFATAAKKIYSGAIYVSGMGGHFAKAEVIIDPNDAENPIKVNNLDRIVIGDKNTHATHDPRIDVNDRNTMFWSTYKLDPNNKVHVGKSDLKTGNVIKDVALDLDARAKGPMPLYCASGQTKTSYMPVMMTTEAYVDVFDKKDLNHKHRVFFDELGYKAGGYKFFHGINTPDMKGFVIAVNLVEEGKPNGKIDLVMLDLKELENGKVKVITKNTITGEPGKTITFRQFFTNDGKYLLQSGGDRMFLLDAKTLKLVDEEMITGGENHDVMPTPDGKYAVLTLRQPLNVKIEEGTKTITDGTLQVYDMEAKKLVGKSVSACNACHEKMGISASAILCGLDGNLK